MSEPGLNPLLTTEEAAEYVGWSKHTLIYWRRHEPDCGPPWVRIGRRVFYRLTDIDAWADEQGIPIDCWRQP
jgi:predicted DNA-binding transcriptional regulator AlpA